MTSNPVTTMTIDLTLVAIYILAMVGLGIGLTRRSSHTEAFIAADRSLPGWAVGMSIFGTYVSSISYLANPGKSFASNWSPFVFSLSLPLAAWMATRFFVPFYRRTGTVSAYTHLEQRFGTWARWYAVMCYLLTQVGRVATILYLVSLAVSPLLEGIDIRWLIVIVGVLVTIYTLTGGIEAVIWTDVVQSLVLTLGMIVTVGVLLYVIPGGFGHVLEVATDRGKFHMGDFGASMMRPAKGASSTFWVVLLYGLIINLQNFGIDQSYVQRYATAESERAARRSVWLGALLYVPTSAVLFFIGTALFVYYQGHAEPGLPARADQVFPFFIQSELPIGIRGILIAAILAAAMSSVDSSLNSSATLILCDVVRRLRRRPMSERGEMRVLYGSTLLFGLLGTTAGLAMTRVATALDAWWAMAGIFGGGMLGLFLLGRISSRVGSAAALLGVSAGVAVILWSSLVTPSSFVWRYLEHFPMARRMTSPLDPLLTIVLGTITILCVGLIASLLFPAGDGRSHTRD